MTTQPEFLIAKNLPFTSRIIVIAVLALIGIWLEFTVLGLFGWLFVLAAGLTGIIRGKSNRPQIARAQEWQTVTMDEIGRISQLLTLESNARGGCSCAAPLIFLLIVVGAGAVILTTAASVGGMMFGGLPYAGLAVGVLLIDAVTLLLPAAISGRAVFWEPPNLRTKLEQLVAIQQAASTIPNVEFHPSLLLAQGRNGSVPLDCKLMVTLPGSPADFMGIQSQTTLNEGQPYTYCILLAKPAFQLVPKARQFVKINSDLLFGHSGVDDSRLPSYKELVAELKVQDDMHIVVIRKPTSSSDYSTSPTDAGGIFVVAYQLAKSVLRG